MQSQASSSKSTPTAGAVIAADDKTLVDGPSKTPITSAAAQLLISADNKKATPSTAPILLSAVAINKNKSKIPTEYKFFMQYLWRTLEAVEKVKDNDAEYTSLIVGQINNFLKQQRWTTTCLERVNLNRIAYLLEKEQKGHKEREQHLRKVDPDFLYYNPENCSAYVVAEIFSLTSFDQWDSSRLEELRETSTLAKLLLFFHYETDMAARRFKGALQRELTEAKNPIHQHRLASVLLEQKKINEGNAALKRVIEESKENYAPALYKMARSILMNVKAQVGVPEGEDEKAAKVFLAKADELGFAEAQFFIAESYAKGEVYSRDSNQSFFFLKKSALDGEYADALHVFGALISLHKLGYPCVTLQQVELDERQFVFYELLLQDNIKKELDKFSVEQASQFLSEKSEHKPKLYKKLLEKLAENAEKLAEDEIKRARAEKEKIILDARGLIETARKHKQKVRNALSGVKRLFLNLKKAAGKACASKDVKEAQAELKNVSVIITNIQEKENKAKVALDQMQATLKNIGESAIEMTIKRDANIKDQLVVAQNNVRKINDFVKSAKEIADNAALNVKDKIAIEEREKETIKETAKKLEAEAILASQQLSREEKSEKQVTKKPETEIISASQHPLREKEPAKQAAKKPETKNILASQQSSREKESAKQAVAKPRAEIILASQQPSQTPYPPQASYVYFDPTRQYYGPEYMLAYQTGQAAVPAVYLQVVPSASQQPVKYDAKAYPSQSSQQLQYYYVQNPVLSYMPMNNGVSIPAASPVVQPAAPPQGQQAQLLGRFGLYSTARPQTQSFVQCFYPYPQNP